MSSDDRQWWQQNLSPIKARYIDKFAIGETALDLGTGAGFYAQMLLKKQFKVIGVDLSPRQNLEYPCIQARLAQLPLQKQFDTVLAFDILEHEPMEIEALHELRRVTKKRLLLSVPNANDALLTPYNLTFKHHIDKTHCREYSLEELQEKLEAVGFDVVEIRREGPVDPAMIAEFAPGKYLKKLVRLSVKALTKINFLKNDQILADVYVVAEPNEATNSRP